MSSSAYLPVSITYLFSISFSSSPPLRQPSLVIWKIIQLLWSTFTTSPSLSLQIWQQYWISAIKNTMLWSVIVCDHLTLVSVIPGKMADLSLGTCRSLWQQNMFNHASFRRHTDRNPLSEEEGSLHATTYLSQIGKKEEKWRLRRYCPPFIPYSSSLAITPSPILATWSMSLG